MDDFTAVSPILEVPSDSSPVQFEFLKNNSIHQLPILRWPYPKARKPLVIVIVLDESRREESQEERLSASKFLRAILDKFCRLPGFCGMAYEMRNANLPEVGKIGRTKGNAFVRLARSPWTKEFGRTSHADRRLSLFTRESRPMKRLTMRKIKDAMRLQASGLSTRKIAASLGVGHSTTTDYMKRIRLAGLTWPLPTDMTDASLEALLFHPSGGPSRLVEAQPDWSTIHWELRRPGVTLSLLWEEYRGAQRACRENLTVIYHRLPRLFADLELAHGDGSFPRLFRTIVKADLLILDDWGPDRLTAGQRRDLMEIVEDRHGRGSILITSQLPVTAWHAVIDEPTFADAILDRLAHNAHRLELDGHSMRRSGSPAENIDEGQRA